MTVCMCAMLSATCLYLSFHLFALQGHIDMVCEKNKDVEHDFMKDPIRLRLEGDWLMATGTTLGSDNGIGETGPGSAAAG